MNLSTLIREELRAVAAEQGETAPAELADHLPVFDAGLDSLGFAILVARLEERLGFDPFVAMAEPVYPSTVGEFVDIYERHATAHAA